MARMTEREIKFYEAHGFKRWTKGSMDRLYINIQQLADKVDGNDIMWCGEWAGSADSRRLRNSKVWLDVNTGKLHVRTEYHQASWEQGKDVIDVARAYIEGIESETTKADNESKEDSMKKYQIIIEDAAENCDEILLNEQFDDETDARERFDQLKAEFEDPSGGWREGLDLWMFEQIDKATSASVDGVSK